MLLVERFWKAITTALSVITFSPINNVDRHQTPLGVSLTDVVDTVPAAGQPSIDARPIFTPPGTARRGEEFYSDFKCDYSAMKGWVSCTSPEDRTCWLKKTDGSEDPFTVLTDYETRTPTGITRNYTLDLVEGMLSADGMPFTEAKIFNGSYPGPWIEACWGDTLNIKVINSLTYNGTSVHWHGVRQLFSVQSDGVNGVTQCPIAPQDDYTYSFRVTQHGSSWYHSHYTVQYADGAAGGMTFHGPAIAPYDQAVNPPTIMTDWGHNTAYLSVITEKLSNADILLNGLGNITRFNNRTQNTTTILPAFNVNFTKASPGTRARRYLMRLINTSFQTTFVFTIDHHSFTVVEADFVPIQAYKTDYILVGIGQRYDIIVDAFPYPYNSTDILPSDGNYWIRTYIASCYASMGSGTEGYEKTGVLRYNSSSSTDPTTLPWPDVVKNKSTICADPTYSNDSFMTPLVPWAVPTPTADLIGSQGPFTIEGGINGTLPYPLAFWHLGSIVNPEPLRVNYSNATFTNLSNNGPWPPPARVEAIDSTGPNQWAYIVIQVMPGWGSHPIHLHGHDFAIIKSGFGLYDASEAFTFPPNPPRRDVILLPEGKEAGEAKENYGGHVVIAFKLDNPGVWLLHCHIAFHVSRGLGMQILEDREKALSIWGPDNPQMLEAGRVCDKWNAWAGIQSHWFNQTRYCRETDITLCNMNDSGV